MTGAENVGVFIGEKVWLENRTPGNYPEESIQHSEHGESLKSRKCHTINNLGLDYKFSDSIHLSHICVNMSVVLLVLSEQN